MALKIKDDFSTFLQKCGIVSLRVWIQIRTCLNLKIPDLDQYTTTSVRCVGHCPL
jgi:hypothetical protein